VLEDLQSSRTKFNSEHYEGDGHGQLCRKQQRGRVSRGMILL